MRVHLLLGSTLVLLSAIAAIPAQAQQIGDRSMFQFKLLGSNAALSRAVVLKQVKDNSLGGNTSINSNITTNNSSSIGALTQIEASLNGNNSELNLTNDSTQSNTGAQDAKSDQKR